MLEGQYKKWGFKIYQDNDGFKIRFWELETGEVIARYVRNSFKQALLQLSRIIEQAEDYEFLEEHNCALCDNEMDSCTCVQCPECKGKSGYIDYAYNNRRGYDQDVDCGWCDGIGKVKYQGWEHPEYTKWKQQADQ